MSGRAYSAFLIRRAARVYPLYLVMLLATVAELALSPHHRLALARGFGATFLHNILMVQSWGLDYSLNGPSWSISTELAAYLLFPMLLMGLVRNRTSVWVPATFCLAVIAITASRTTPDPVLLVKGGPLDVYWPRSLWPLARCVSEFCLGIIAFRVAQAGTTPMTNTVFVWAVGIAAVALLFVPDSDVLFVCLVPPLLIGITKRGHPISRFLSSPVPMVLGRWSYAIYLCHDLLIGVDYRAISLAWRVVPGVSAKIVGEAAFWTVLLFVAAMSFRFVEVPGRRMIRRFETQLFPDEHRVIIGSKVSGAEISRDA